MRLLPYGDRALLVELDDTAQAVAWAAGLEAAEPGLRDRVVQVVPAARTVLVVAGPDLPLADLRRAVRDVVPVDPGTGASGDAHHGADRVEVPVVYDGEDLDEVARLTGLGRAEVVAAHTGADWRVGFGGFAPGFAYLIGPDDRLHVPRREESRSRVPAGAVGLAGEYSGVYPTASPGGWQLIGRTDLVLWDVDRDPPALLRPGVRVRFVEVTGAAGTARTARTARTAGDGS